MNRKERQHSWAMPIEGNDIWILFDLSNGDTGSKRYLWWFSTRKDALKYRRFHNKSKYSAALSMPRRFTAR